MKNYKWPIITFILSFCSIVYELILANSLALLSGYHILWQSLTIGIYIGALGIGAYHSEKKIKGGKEVEVLIHAETWLSLIGLLAILIIFFLNATTRMFDIENILTEGIVPYYTGNTPKIYKGIFVGLSSIVTVLVGYFSGFEIPTLINLENKRVKKSRESRTNIILGFNYIGALAGTLALVFYLHPKLDLIFTSLIVSALNMGVLIYLIANESKNPKKRTLFGMVAYFVLFFVIILHEKGIQQTYLKTFYYFKEDVFNAHLREEKLMPKRKFFKTLDQRPEVLRKKSLYQYIDLFIRTYADYTPGIQMHLDGHFQFDTASEAYYHEGFVHLPHLIYNYFPKNVLVLGGGDGMLIRELLKYKEVETITHIELDKDMIKLSHETPEIKAINKGALFDKRVKRIFTDGFYYLRTSKKQYDAIYIDFPYPHNYNLAKLYSKEFYYYARQRLNPDGFVVFDCPIFPKEYDYQKWQTSFDLNSILFSTAKAAGFKTVQGLFVSNEGFLVMSPKERKANPLFLKNKPNHLKALYDDPALYDLLDFTWTRKEGSKYVNSIFRPTIVNKVPAVF